MPRETITRKYREGRITLEDFPTRSHIFLTLLDGLRSCAGRGRAILLTGESGTGKTLLAEAIHNSSPRRDKPFVFLNASELRAEVLASELFGHRKGAFTGATSDRDGLFRTAKGGTLFIDEVAELPPDLQVQLNHAIEYRTIRPVGSDQRVSVDVRLVFATHVPLQTLFSDPARWRPDFLARIAQRTLHVPSLSERVEDLPLLVEALLDGLCAVDGVPRPRVDDGVLSELASRPWPGNLRDLQGVLDRALDECDGAVLLPGHLPPASRLQATLPAVRSLDAVVHEACLAAVAACDGNQTEAARVLGIARNTLAGHLRASKRAARIVDSAPNAA